MKVGKHIDYLDVHDAIVALTKTCYKTSDIKIKSFRDLLEEYLDKEVNNGLIVLDEEGSVSEEILYKECNHPHCKCMNLDKQCSNKHFGDCVKKIKS